MTTFTVPKGCTGVELPNGKKYDATRGGKVKIDDAREAKYASKTVLAGNGVLSRTVTTFSEVKGTSKVCSSCSFVGWKWQVTCPKCSGEMIQETI
jgi:hypothetical protein